MYVKEGLLFNGIVCLVVQRVIIHVRAESSLIARFLLFTLVSLGLVPLVPYI